MLADSDEGAAAAADLRHLPRPPAAVPGCGLQDLQDEVRQPRRAPRTEL